MKINFPNKDAVYMHDTPLKSLFGRNVRFESSGCVRVHNVEGLVAWILRDTPGWSLERMLSMKQTGEQADVKLSKPVPVYLAYISAWCTPDGGELPPRHLQSSTGLHDRLETTRRRASLAPRHGRFAFARPFLAVLLARPRDMW